MNKKILLITNIPTPYRIPLFNTLSQLCLKENFRLKVVFLAKGYPRRKWKSPLNEARFEYEILKSLPIRLNEEGYLFIPFNLFRILLKEQPSVIIVIGFSITTIFIFLFHLFKKTPYIIWSGEIGREAKLSSSVASPFMTRKYSKMVLQSFRRLLRKMLIKKSSALLAYGTKAGEYLKGLNSTKPIFYGWNTVDTSFFTERVNQLKERKTDILHLTGLKSLLQIEGERKDVNILTIGYLIKRKGFDYVLKALKIIREKNTCFMLHIIGDGSERKDLESLTRDLGLRENVYFWGYKQREELPKFFAIADFFVFPSLFDIWGLVPIEAMSCGLPVIASKYAGATYDLVQDGVNGFVVDPYDLTQMAEKIKILIENPELRKKMGEKAKETIQKRFTLEKSARGFLEAVKWTVKKGED